MLYMRLLGTGKSAGAFSDDQEWEKTARLLKTMLWLIGQGSFSVNRIFPHIFSSQSQAKLIPRASVISITFIQGVLVSQRGEGRLAGSQERWSKRSQLSVSLERRSMWEQIHVEDVAVGDCFEIPVVWWRRGGHKDDAPHGDESSQSWELLWKLYVKVILKSDLYSAWTGYKMTGDGLNTLSSSASHHLFLLIKTVHLESSN